jgi:acyl-CoA thioester hydrolase
MPVQGNGLEFSWERRVEFCETDAAGIAHFSSLILYMEQAEHALLRSVGLSVYDRSGTTGFSWPRIKVEAEFQSPARFEEVLQVLVSIEDFGNKSISYYHRIMSGDKAIATGRMKVVCCLIKDSALVSCEIPESVRSLLHPFVVSRKAP